MRASAGSLAEHQSLLLLGSEAPLAWPGPVVDITAAGPLCADRPASLAVWAPADCLPRAFGLLAMFKSVRCEGSLVLTDRLPPLDCVPRDGRLALVQGGRRGPIHAGQAAFTCADLRSDHVFRLLLAGRARRRPELQPLLGLHLLALTPHGRRVLAEWRDTIPVLFAGGLQGMMPDALRTDLEELAQGALDSEYAITGGFHALDPVVRGPADWEAGANRYLSLAASHSPTAAAEVRRWLASQSGWDAASPHRQDRLRVTAARALHRLVDDPWLSHREASDLFRRRREARCHGSAVP